VLFPSVTPSGSSIQKTSSPHECSGNILISGSKVSEANHHQWSPQWDQLGDSRALPNQFSSYPRICTELVASSEPSASPGPTTSQQRPEHLGTMPGFSPSEISRVDFKVCFLVSPVVHLVQLPILAPSVGPSAALRTSAGQEWLASASPVLCNVSPSGAPECGTECFSKVRLSASPVNATALV
jgi:hypothetical protein